MVIDTTRLFFLFIISALSAMVCIFPNRETVGEPVEPLPAALPDCCLRACRTVACGFAGLLPAGFGQQRLLFVRRGLLDKCVVIAEKFGWSSLKSALSDCLKRQALLLVRGIDSEFGEGEEAGPFGETDTDGVGVNLVEAVDFHTAL